MKTEEQKPDNPKAFPNDWNINDGMTLRDYFAAKNAYLISDAMLKQRELC